MSEMKPLPESMYRNTGDYTGVRETIDDFFNDTRAFVLENIFPEAENFGDFAIKDGNIGRDTGARTDDRVEYLTYRGLPIAMVVEARSDYNFVGYTFFRNVDALYTRFVGKR